MKTRGFNLCAVMLLAAMPAAADIAAVGDPIPGGSWGQRFAFSSADGADMVAVFLLGGGPFESPTLRRLDSPAWETQLDTKDLAAAGSPGNPVEQLTFEVWFDAEPTEPLSFIFAAWHPGEQFSFETYQLTWTEVGRCCVWVDAPVPRVTQPIDWPAVPALPAAALGGIGLGLIGWTKVPCELRPSS